MLLVRFVVALVSVAAAVSPAFAQSAPTSDVTAQVTVLRLTDADASSTGIGARVSAGLSRWLSLDGEVTFTPSDEVSTAIRVAGQNDGGLVYQRRRVDGLLGVKAGYRSGRVGVFAKARPGFSRLSNQGIDCRGDVCALILIAPPEYKTQFIMDIGGVVEFYPSDRLLARIDIGNTIVRHRGSAPPCNGCTRNNLTSKFGFGLRF